jgi:hypothetical protein
MHDARFAKRQNGGADFRLSAGSSTLTAHRVSGGVPRARRAVEIGTPGSGRREYAVHGLIPRARYRVGGARADADGVLRFDAAGDTVRVRLDSRGDSD